jgi:hypothetical protein
MYQMISRIRQWWYACKRKRWFVRHVRSWDDRREGIKRPKASYGDCRSANDQTAT